MDQTRVVLDCDTANEVDDQFAIAHALGLPEGTLDVRGVISVHNTTAHGPGSRDMYQEEAERVVALCALGRPVASYLAGILQPLAAEYEDRPGKELWDLACVAADPGAITSGPLAVPKVDAAGAHDFTRTGREVDVVSDLDERRVLAGLMQALARHPS
ncbi:MAG TPA: hypothetical protein VE525_09885 [Rubrobacter sp.]|jgi:hypothetical protein|nr:hypothetical protein [Rubrobacter sp.]